MRECLSRNIKLEWEEYVCSQLSSSVYTRRLQVGQQHGPQVSEFLVHRNDRTSSVQSHYHVMESAAERMLKERDQLKWVTNRKKFFACTGGGMYREFPLYWREMMLMKTVIAVL